MKSKANFKGHPLHPILVSFPIAFLTGSFLFDLAAWLFDHPQLSQTAYWIQIAGVGLGLVAAVPGFIDYLYTVPPKSTGKKRATQHALTNVTNLVLFTGIWLYRRDPASSQYIIMGLELIGLVLLSVAGWMGGTLVFRNQIGVDPRYANAGKWKDETFNGKGKIVVAKSDELKTNQMKLIRVNNKRLVLGRTEEGYVVFDDHCTHRGGSLAGGSMICGTVQCPWHGSQYDVKTGQVKAGPAKNNIKTYPVTEEGGKVLLNA
jgi:uncharacterized membrane protein/nitrite reductase/ring-hydroxylating ferredoxin subunit